MTNELAKNIITEYVFADYDISSIYKFLNTKASLDESDKQLYSEALLTRAIDISNTKKVKEGAELLTIELFDHIIVGADTNYCSLREQGNI